MKKVILVTHADVDHCGLLPMFDEVITSHKTALCLKNEYNGKNGYREENLFSLFRGQKRRGQADYRKEKTLYI
mgnify:CR=1 FL=1